MSEYVATFYTHLSAMLTLRALKEGGLRADMESVPRELSASCGSCVRYSAEDAARGLMHRDFQAIYRVNGRGYEMVESNDAIL